MAKTKSSKRRSAKSRSQREFGGMMSKAATMMESRKDLAGERLTKLPWRRARLQKASTSSPICGTIPTLRLNFYTSHREISR